MNLTAPSPTESSSDESPKSSARHPLTATEHSAWVRQQQARPRCVSCSQALLLIPPGRDQCERCQSTPWVVVSGNPAATVA